MVAVAVLVPPSFVIQHRLHSPPAMHVHLPRPSHIRLLERLHIILVLLSLRVQFNQSCVSDQHSVRKR